MISFSQPEAPSGLEWEKFKIDVRREMNNSVFNDSSLNKLSPSENVSFQSQFNGKYITVLLWATIIVHLFDAHCI